MKRFLQIHMLTSYPPSNLNRDDLGRPKTAVVGGTNRLRISSQSLKRAWRTSTVFQESLGTIDINGGLAIRSKRFGEEVYNKLIVGGIKEKDATDWSIKIAECFGKPKGKGEHPENLYIEQLAFISPEEQKAVFELVDILIQAKKNAPTAEQLKLLKKDNSAADLALFGRMLASEPAFNVEAAAQVAHAFSVQKIVIEDDYFTAVDDLNKGEEDAGAGHIGETEFASGIFYAYINIDRELLNENLNSDKKLTNKAIQSLIKAAATVAPTGKQNSFASRAYAHYILAELGDQQPRSLSLAFVKPINDADMLEKSITALEQIRVKLEQAYGKCSDKNEIMNIISGEGSIDSLLNFCISE